MKVLVKIRVIVGGLVGMIRVSKGKGLGTF